MDLYRERLVSTNASEVKETSVEVRNTSDRGHFCFRSDNFAFVISFYNFHSFCELACCLCESQDLFSSAVRCIKVCFVTLA